MVPTGGSPDSMRVQERIQALALTRCSGPWTHGDNDAVKNLDEAEDTCRKLSLDHILDDPTIQFEVATVMSGMCNPAVGVVARLMWVIATALRSRCSHDVPASSSSKGVE